MWIFANDAAASIVQDRVSKDHLWIRARVKGHLQKFLKVFPAKQRPPVKHTPDADYAFRAFITRDQLHVIMKALVENIDYTNFKDSIMDTSYHAACSKVWSAFMNACNTGCYAARKFFPRNSRSVAKANNALAALDADSTYDTDVDSAFFSTGRVRC